MSDKEIEYYTREIARIPIEGAWDIKNILNDKWVLWTSLFNSNSLCFYLVFDYISMSHSYSERTGNYKRRRRKRRRRRRRSRKISKNVLVDPESYTASTLSHTDSFVALTQASKHATADDDQFFSSIFTLLVDFVHGDRNLSTDDFFMFFTWKNKYIEMKMLMYVHFSIALSSCVRLRHFHLHVMWNEITIKKHLLAVQRYGLHLYSFHVLVSGVSFLSLPHSLSYSSLLVFRT